MEARPFNLSLLNINVPTENNTRDEKDKFYEKIEEDIEMIPKDTTQYWYWEILMHKLQQNCNLAARKGMIISSSKHKHPKNHKTWTSPNQIFHAQIDHILINKRKQSSMKDVRTYREACADSDHFMVTAIAKHKVKKMSNSIKK